MSGEKRVKRVAFGEAIKDESGEIHEVEYGAKAVNVLCSNGRSVDAMMREMQGSRGEYGEPGYDKVVVPKEMALYIFTGFNDHAVNAEGATYGLSIPEAASDPWNLGILLSGRDPGRFNRFGIIYNFVLYEPFQENGKRICCVDPIEVNMTFYNDETARMNQNAEGLNPDGTYMIQLAACKGNPFGLEESFNNDIAFGPSSGWSQINALNLLDLGQAILCNTDTGEKTTTEMHVYAMYVRSIYKLVKQEEQIKKGFSIETDFTVFFMDKVPAENTYPKMSMVGLSRTAAQQRPSEAWFQIPDDLKISKSYSSGYIIRVFDHTGQYYDYTYLTEQEESSEAEGGEDETTSGLEGGA